MEVIVIKTIKALVNQIKAHPIAVCFLMISYITSSILISVWTSNSVQLRNLALLKTQGLANNTLEVTASFGKDTSFDTFVSTFENISKESNITIQKIYVKLEDKDITIPMSLEYFKSTPNWRYPLLRGKDYTVEDVVSGEHKILIGKNLEKFVYAEAGKEKIKILDEGYEVTGIIGLRGQATPWDEQVFIPLKAAPKLSKIRFNGEQAFSFLIKNNVKQPIEDCKALERNIKSDSGIFSIRELDIKNDIIANSFSNNDSLTQVTLTVFFLAIISMMNIGIYWIDDRRKEIGIRKAFGITNFNIASMLFSEMFLLCLLGSILGLVLQFLLNIFIERFSNYTLSIGIENLLSGIAVSFIAAIFTIIIPIYKSLKIQPIEVLKS